MKKKFVAAFTAVGVTFSVAGAAATGTVIESGAYASDREAQAAWSPMFHGAKVGRGEREGRRALRMPCDFAGTRMERASWDRRVTVDLSGATGVRFEVFCGDPAPVSFFSLYFQSGEGWYSASFFPENAGVWNTISLSKGEFRGEGSPAGWGKIRTIRVSAWRGNDADTEFYFRDLRPAGVLGQDALVAVVRSDSAAERWPEEARSLTQAAETVAQVLHEAGIGAAMISDRELAGEELGKARLVVLPFSPVLSETGLRAVRAYVGSGGKVLAFYAVPPELLGPLGLRDGPHVKAPRAGAFSVIRPRAGALAGAPRMVKQSSWNIRALEPVPGQGTTAAEWLDDKNQATGYPAIIASSNCLFMTHILLPDGGENKQRLLLAMAAALSPEIDRQATEGALEWIGRIASYRSFEELEREVKGKKGALEKLERASRLRSEATRLAKGGRFAESRERAAEARENAVEAFCRAQEGLAGEFRAFWCHSAVGVEGRGWEEAIGRLAENGFTAVLPNMVWGGAAFYESQVLPVARQAREKGDQIRECLAACKKHGVEAHVWKVNWNLGSAAPKEFAERMRREGRLQSSAGGQEEPWLCPSHPENQRVEIESMVEVAREYDVDGIHFDYIRYPDSSHCFCAGCRERFAGVCGGKLKTWPGDVLAGGELRERWLDWRRSNITAVVKAVSEKARAVRPRIRISAAVFRNWPADRDSVGQDWKVWCERGYLDFVCPMDYTSSNSRFENMVGQQVQWAGKVPCYPGIGVSASSSRFGPDRAIEQILLTRRHRTGGFVIFNYGVAEASELLPRLGMGITARR